MYFCSGQPMHFCCGVDSLSNRIIEELRRRFGDVLRPQEELDYIEPLLKDY
jgi:hypothetical protein